MNLRTLNHSFPAGAAAVAASLALAATTAPALQTNNAVSAHSAPGQHINNLTPVAPVSSKVPASSAEDIRDIRQPRHLPTPIPWAAAAIGVSLLAGAGYGAWRWLRARGLALLTPQELALRKLHDARSLMNPEHAREYCFAVSEIIRNYVEAQFHIHAPRLTTEEFLRDLVEAPQQMLNTHRTLLGTFLQHCDLAKFAGWRYSTPDLEEMHHSAQDFVHQTAMDSVPVTASSSPTTAQPTPVNH